MHVCCTEKEENTSALKEGKWDKMSEDDIKKQIKRILYRQEDQMKTSFKVLGRSLFSVSFGENFV